MVREIVGAVPAGSVMILERDRPPGHGGIGDRDRLHRLRLLRRVTREADAPLVVSARPDLAVAAAAEGVQLPEVGLDPLSVRRAFPSLAIGRSCHDRAGLLEAQAASADWALLAPVWPPRSKPASGPPLGVEGFRSAIRAVRLPVFALGGVTAERAPEALAAGATGVACIGAVLQARDPASAASALVRAARGVAS